MHLHFPTFVTQEENLKIQLSSLQRRLIPPYLSESAIDPARPTPNAIMCPSCNGDVVNGTNGDVPAATNGQANSTNGYGPHTPHNPRRQPFGSLGDYLSNVSNFKIIESTLREGEQVSKHPRF